MTQNRIGGHLREQPATGVRAWMGKRRITWRTFAQFGLLIIMLILTFFPVYIMLSMAFRPTVLIYSQYWGAPWPPVMENFQQALLDLVPAMRRTLMLAAVTVTLDIVIAAPAAYAFGRMRAPGKDKLFLLILAVMMIPSIVLLVPQYVLAKQLDLIRSYWGLIVFYVAGAQPFAIFLMSTFFRSQPAEMFEAAKVDGASDLQCMMNIALPLARPIIVTLIILNFLGVYNDFIWPGLILTGQQETLMLALWRYDPRLSQFFNRPDLGAQAAGYAFATIPLLFIFIFGMKYFIQGVTSGAIKA